MKHLIFSAILAPALLLAGCCTSYHHKTTVNVAGQWHWVCCDGNFHGEMTLHQQAGKITGRLFDVNDTTGGAIVGSISGNAVQLTRTWGDSFRQDYSLTLSADGKKLEGTFDGTQDTRFSTQFEATRE